jgi:nitroalkane oxidase
MRIEAARYLTWKSCHYLEQTGGRGQELAVMTKVYCSELAVQVVYDAMRLVGVESYTKKTPLERLLRDALVFSCLHLSGEMASINDRFHFKAISPPTHLFLI